MKNTKKLLYVAATLEMTGLALLAFIASSWLIQPDASAYAVPTPITKAERSSVTSTQPVVSGKPRTVRVPTVGVDTSVQDGTYNPKQATWTISEDAAFFATLTDEINPQAGNTFVYGHNSQKIFGKLRSTLSEGTKAYVETDNGYEFTYVYKEAHDVAPSDVNKISPTSDKPQLILQTCSGLFNETRRLVYFEFVSYRKV